jgi:hypothetical protein
VNDLPHRIFILFLLLLGITTIAAILFQNYDYYALSLEERPFHPQYDELKPSGYQSHGYGIAGTAMIITGVAMYSGRKRIRKFSQVGKIKYFLEFHIFLCLLGPALVLYHTTFKFGGIVAVSFWSMSAVVLSGVIGRYLYQHIPKNIQGSELTDKELETESKRLIYSLHTQYHLSHDILDELEQLEISSIKAENLGITKLIIFLLKSDFSRLRRNSAIKKILFHHNVNAKDCKQIVSIVNQRIVLQQRIAVLGKMQQVFHYWHVVHLPFTIIMFLILIVHVAVAIAFGYTWVF